jgi:hypothetical protein
MNETSFYLYLNNIWQQDWGRWAAGGGVLYLGALAMMTQDVVLQQEKYLYTVQQLARYWYFLHKPVPLYAQLSHKLSSEKDWAYPSTYHQPYYSTLFHVRNLICEKI